METTTSVTPIILHITVIQILKFSKGKVQSDNQGEQVSYQNVLQTAEIQSPQWRRIAQIISRWSQHRLTAHGWKSRPGDKCESRGGEGGALWLKRNSWEPRPCGPWFGFANSEISCMSDSFHTATHINTKYPKRSIMLAPLYFHNHSLRSRRDRLREESFRAEELRRRAENWAGGRRFEIQIGYSALASLGKAVQEWRHRRQNSRTSNNNSARYIGYNSHCNLFAIPQSAPYHCGQKAEFSLSYASSCIEKGASR